ncbi:MAG: hypothetical protein B6U86_02955 [Candidatus Altiarchaeales archaeon ex4484_43]|nr:MAG: hypothetical protein B6U86_02955 [Candidatus Altiarchaeales archaeon ex4484_43]RLI89140.1 MAG: hypothetical protein DRO62_02240 [Candidatus Altiarchaeales archaeon]
MSTATPVEQSLWDEIEIDEEWVGRPKKRPNPLVVALKESLILIEVCLMAFAIGVVSGYILFEESTNVVMPLIEKIENEFSLRESNFQLAIEIFFNNLRTTIIMLLGGTFLFIPLLILMVNGFLVGFVLRLFLEEGHDIFEFIRGILLHSIFELPAVFISAAIGIRIGLAYLSPKSNRAVAVSERIKEAGAIYIAIVIPLLLLAAFAEVYISMALIP